MISYFLKSDSKIENALRENSVNFYAMNNGEVKGIVINVNLDTLNKMIKKAYKNNVEVDCVKETQYEGIEEIRLRFHDEDRYDILLSKRGDIENDIRDIDVEMKELKMERERIEKEMEDIDADIEELKEKEARIEHIDAYVGKSIPQKEKEAEDLLKYGDEIIL